METKMKTILTIAVILLTAPLLRAAADYSSTKQGTTITYRDGSSEHAKLDFIDENSVSIIKQGSSGKLETFKIPRNKVDSLSFNGKDYSGRFSAGEEGFVLDDGQVLKGIVEGLDESTFWRRLSEGGRTERLDRDKVVFIQFRKVAPAEPPSPVHPPKKMTVDVLSKQAWTLTNIQLKEGDHVFFSTDPNKPIICGGIPNTNADGVNPFTPDPQRPLPDVKACALIGKMGNDLFRIGTVQGAFVAKQDCELILGINDWRFSGNGGAFSVTILVEQ